MSKKSKWKVVSQEYCGKWIYAVYRLRDITAGDHFGNREYAVNNISNESLARRIADDLNSRGDNNANT